MSPFKAIIIFGIVSSVWSAPTYAAERREAIMLEGTACLKERDIIRQSLLKLSGVRGVDAQSLPGYLLVEVVVGMVTAVEMAATINHIHIAEGTCRAEPMQSCISTDGHHRIEHATSVQAKHE